MNNYIQYKMLKQRDKGRLQSVVRKEAKVTVKATVDSIKSFNEFLFTDASLASYRQRTLKDGNSHVCETMARLIKVFADRKMHIVITYRLFMTIETLSEGL